MISTSLIYQLLVSGSILLAALSVGCAVTYPGVLLKQLAAENSTIRLDLDTASWMGSIHGLAGIPSILMPVFMQWRGRKITFIIACIFNVTGWILAYTSSTSKMILISESFHGFGAQSVMAVGSLSMSELLSPKFKQVALTLYLVLLGLGMALVNVLGWYIHWKTVSLITVVPMVLAGLMTCFWPESPYWLAYKGDYEKCTKAFTRLRGSSDSAKMELEELILAQKENQNLEKWKRRSTFKHFWNILKSKDFYVPSSHMLVLVMTIYWSGFMALLIYSSQMMHYKVDKNLIFSEGVIYNLIYFLGCIANIFLKHYFKLKSILVACMSCAILCLLSSSAVNYSQIHGYISDNLNICFYLFIVYISAISVGGSPTVFSFIAELMPVKYRGVGGPLYVILISTLQSSSLKLAPYLILYMNLWGTLLLYAANGIVCTLIIWKYVPEIKGRTLQQIEDYYAYGNFDRTRAKRSAKYLQKLAEDDL